MKVLPIRPRPIPLEPLWGYVDRLAKANGYSTAKEFWALLTDGTASPQEVLQFALKLDRLPVFGAPAPRWLPLPVDSRGLAPVHYNRYELRICSHCFSERPQVRPVWSLNFAVACFKHKCWLKPFAARLDGSVEFLADSDGPSGVVLALSRLLEKSLEKNKPVRHQTLSALGTSLSTLKILKLIKALASIDSPEPGKQQNIAKLYVFRNAREHFVRAASLLENWPVSFWKLLDKRMMALPDSLSIQEVFGGISDVLYDELKEPEYNFLRQGFESYLADFWRGEINGRHRRFNRDLMVGQHRISIAKAEKKLRVGDRKIKSMITSGELSKVSVATMGKREFTTIDIDELKEILAMKSKMLDLKATSELLGLNQRRLRELITGGYLLALASPSESSDNRWQIEEDVINALEKDLLKARKPISDAISVVSLNHALRFWRFSPREWCALFHAMRIGEIPFRCIGSFSFAKIELEKSALSLWLKERVKNEHMPIDIRNAAIVLNIKEEVMYQLVANGLFPTSVAIKRGRIYRGLNSVDIRSFEKKYVSLADLAKEHKTSPTFLRRNLSIEPVIGPGIDGCRQYFYLRESVIMEEKKRNDAKYKKLRIELGI